MVRKSYHPRLGAFPNSYRFIRVGDTCIFSLTTPLKGMKQGAELIGKVLRIYLEDKVPHLIVSIDPCKHKLQSQLFVIYPKGAAYFDAFLKIKGTGLGTKLRQRAAEERAGIFQGDLILPFGK